jgi:hypothetical protein
MNRKSIIGWTTLSIGIIGSLLIMGLYWLSIFKINQKLTSALGENWEINNGVPGVNVEITNRYYLLNSFTIIHLIFFMGFSILGSIILCNRAKIEN